MKTIFTTLFILMTTATCIIAQRKLTGIVRSAADGKPLAGATVTLKAINSHTITNSKGEFQLQMPPKQDTVYVSFVGHISSRILILADVTLPLIINLKTDEPVLKEVMINTGYYQTPRERATGSFTHIDQGLISRSTGSNILQRLEGSAAGLQFVNAGGSSASDIRIRGLMTIESDQTPLIVMDNFPYEGDINSINPNDVESITILKDAAAASIWGARAGNGVIVITTKQGKYNQKARISLQSNITIAEKPDLYRNPNYLPSATVMGIEKELFELGNYTLDPESPLPGYITLLVKKKENGITDREFLTQEDILKQTDVRAQALRYLYQNPVNRQLALNLTGGGSNYGYYLSAGFDGNNSHIKGNTYRRLNLNMQNTYRPLKDLEVTAGIWYTSQQSENNGLSLDNLNPEVGKALSPYQRLADEYGNPIAIPFERSMAYQDGAVAKGLLNWHYRPLDEIRLSDHNSGSTELRLNSGVKYSLLNGLNLNATYQYRQSAGTGKNYYNRESYYVRNLVNLYTQADGSRVIPHQGILDGERQSESISHSGRLQLNYNRSIGTAHQLTALAGAEIRQLITSYFPGYRIYNYNPDILTGTNAYDFNRMYPLITGGTARLPAPHAERGQYTDRYLSYFGNAAYTLKDLYTISGSLRWDGSNLFGVKTNQKGVPLWSAGASWHLSKEDFYSLSWLPSLRLRITYGSSGNVNKTVSTFPTIHQSNNRVTQLPAATILSTGNPSLCWERVNTLNTGLDFSMAGHRISGSIEYYLKKSKDLIGLDYMDPTTGISGEVLQNKINYANMKSQGLDLQLNTRNIQGVFSWQSGFIFSYVSNKITHFNTADTDKISYYTQTGPPPMKGRSRDAVYALPWHGLSNQSGMPVIFINNQVSNDYQAYYDNFKVKDLILAGVSVAPLYGSFRNTISYKNFSLDALITWKSGYVFHRNSIAPGAEYRGNYHTDYFKRWQKSGDERFTNVPAKIAPSGLNYNYALEAAYKDSEALITKGDHIRLQDVNLSYSLSRNKTSRLPAQNIRLYVYARNLGMIWLANKEHIDPDDINGGYAAPLTISAGLQLDF